MSFFASFFREKRAESVVLVEVTGTSVAGAYVAHSEGQAPVLLYVHRTAVEVHAGELLEEAVARALDKVGEALLREGAPALMRHAGNGRADTILLAIGAPWQELSLRREDFEDKESFVFSQELIEEALVDTSRPRAGTLRVDQSVIATLLNGYETLHPQGKKARRASLHILTSMTNETITAMATSKLRAIFHSDKILTISASSLHYQAMRSAFPHENDALILDADGTETTITLIRGGLLSALVHTDGENENLLVKELAAIAKRHSLPKTVLLLASESEIGPLRATLTRPDSHSLWVGEDSLTILPILAGHITGLVRHAAETPPDVSLLLMALYAQKTLGNAHA